jgi:hypothetical protein
LEPKTDPERSEGARPNKNYKLRIKNMINKISSYLVEVVIPSPCCTIVA